MKNLKLIVGSFDLRWLFIALFLYVVMAGYKINTIPVHFDKGTSGTTIKNALSGADVKDYTLVAKAGQLMHVTMKSKWPHPYFNVINPRERNHF